MIKKVDIDVMADGHHKGRFIKEYEARFDLRIGDWVVMGDIVKDIHERWPTLKYAKKVEFWPNEPKKKVMMQPKESIMTNY